MKGAGRPAPELHGTDALQGDEDSALRWSPSGVGLTAEPARTFERLYERYVTRYDPTPTAGRKGDETPGAGARRDPDPPGPYRRSNRAARSED